MGEKQVFGEFDDRFGNGGEGVVLKGHNQADLSGRRAADAVANLQHLALVARQEERHKRAVIAFDKARQRGEDDSGDEDAGGDSSSVSDGDA